MTLVPFAAFREAFGAEPDALRFPLQTPDGNIVVDVQFVQKTDFMQAIQLKVLQPADDSAGRLVEIYQTREQEEPPTLIFVDGDTDTKTTDWLALAENLAGEVAFPQRFLPLLYQAGGDSAYAGRFVMARD